METSIERTDDDDEEEEEEEEKLSKRIERWKKRVQEIKNQESEEINNWNVNRTDI